METSSSVCNTKKDHPCAKRCKLANQEPPVINTVMPSFKDSESPIHDLEGCTVLTKEKAIQTQWSLLSAVPYFHALYNFSKQTQTSCDIVDLMDFHQETVELTLHYLSRGHCEITQASLADLLHIADFLRVESFVKYCVVCLHSLLLSPHKISIQEAHKLISRHNLGIDRSLLYNICDVAVEQGYLPLIQYGLSLGMNPNICYEELRECRSGHNLFFKAVINGHHDAAKLLLDAGANVNYQKMSPNCGHLLDERDAPWIENFHAIRLRYSANEGGAGYLCSTTRGTTALHIAVCNNRLDLIRLLVEHGARVQPDQDGETPVHAAAYYGYTETLQFFVQKGYGYMFNTHTNIMGTPLFRAVLSNNVDLVQFMINQGANVTHTDYSGFTVLTYAAVSNNLSLLKYLHENMGLALTEQNDTHETALHQCASLGHVEILKYCIERSPNLMFIQDERGDTLLHVAVLYDQMAAANTLIDTGSNPSIANYLNEQPLHIAIMENCTALIPHLLASGADPNAIINIRDTSTPLTLAIMCGGESTLDYVHLLLKYGADPKQLHNKALQLALRENIVQKAEVVELLLAHGADPNTRNQGTPVLVEICATANASLDLVKLLLKFTADVNLTDRKGITPLMAACAKGNSGVVELLLKSGADTMVRSWHGLTAMLIAKDSPHEASQSIVQLLTELDNITSNIAL